MPDLKPKDLAGMLEGAKQFVNELTPAQQEFATALVAQSIESAVSKPEGLVVGSPSKAIPLNGKGNQHSR
jgi:hypothetical protein